MSVGLDMNCQFSCALILSHTLILFALCDDAPAEVVRVVTASDPFPSQYIGWVGVKFENWHDGHSLGGALTSPDESDCGYFVPSSLLKITSVFLPSYCSCLCFLLQMFTLRVHLTKGLFVVTPVSPCSKSVCNVSTWELGARVEAITQISNITAGATGSLFLAQVSPGLFTCV